jgi:hypothetical protein
MRSILIGPNFIICGGQDQLAVLRRLQGKYKISSRAKWVATTIANSITAIRPNTSLRHHHGGCCRCAICAPSRAVPSVAHNHQFVRMFGEIQARAKQTHAIAASAPQAPSSFVRPQQRVASSRVPTASFWLRVHLVAPDKSDHQAYLAGPEWSVHRRRLAGRYSTRQDSSRLMADRLAARAAACSCLGFSVEG